MPVCKDYDGRERWKNQPFLVIVHYFQFFILTRLFSVSSFVNERNLQQKFIIIRFIPDLNNLNLE